MSALAILKKSYKEIYDEIATVISASMIWFFTAGGLLFLSFLGIQLNFILPAIIAIFLLGPITGGCFYAVNRSLNHNPFNLLDLFKGIKKFFFKSLILSWLIGGLSFVLVFYIYRFSTSEIFIFNILTGIWLYLAFLLLILTFYIWPVLIEFELAGKDTSLKNLIKTTALLLSNEVKFTLFIFLNAIIFSLIIFILMMPFPVVFIGTIALFSNNAMIKLLLEYDLKEEINEPNGFKVQESGIGNQ